MCVRTTTRCRRRRVVGGARRLRDARGGHGPNRRNAPARGDDGPSGQDSRLADGGHLAGRLVAERASWLTESWSPRRERGYVHCGAARSTEKRRRGSMTDSIGSRIRSGLAWKAGSQLTLQVSRMVVALILARLLAPRGLGPRGDGARLLRLRRRLHRQRARDRAHPAADDRRGGPLDRVLDERGDRARADARGHRALRARSRASTASRRSRRCSRCSRWASSSARSGRRSRRSSSATCAFDRLELRQIAATRRRRGRRYRGRARRLRRVGDRRAAPRRGGCVDGAALVPRGVVALGDLLAREPAEARRLRGQRLRREPPLPGRAATSATC